jgi:hypothetical protein
VDGREIATLDDLLFPRGQKQKVASDAKTAAK